MSRKELKRIYYINFGVPSISYSKAMIEYYLSCGANCFQLDLPTRHPNQEIENDYIMKRMKTALMNCADFTQYLDTIRYLKKENPKMDIEMTIYEDTLEEIGVERFIAFCKEAGIDCLSLIEGKLKNNLMKKLRESGIKLLHPMIADAKEEEVNRVLKYREPVILLLESGVTTKTQFDLKTIANTVSILHAKGNTEPVFATMGIKTPEKVKELQACGVEGVYIGSVLMQLWEDKEMLKKKIIEFEGMGKGGDCS